MIKLRSIFLVVAVFAFIFTGCEKDPIEDRRLDEEMIINNDQGNLSGRMNLIEGGRLLPIMPVDHGPAVKSLKTTVAPRYEIYLRAEVDPPSHEGKVLQASHIKIVGNNAFVTYNRQGEEYLGGVDVYDVSDIRNPRLIQNVIFPEKDISSIDIDPAGQGNNHFIYLTGAYNLEYHDLDLVSPAVVEKFIANQANQFVHLAEPRQYHDLPSYMGNDVRYYHEGNEAVYATSGSGGGLTILNNGLRDPRYIPVEYARSIDLEGDRLVVFSAERNNSRLVVMDTDGEIIREIPTGGDHFDDDGKYLEAKSIVRLQDGLAFVAVGTGGMEVYDINSGDMVGSLPRPDILNEENPLNYVSNGVSVHGDLVLVANGGSGVHIAWNDGTGEMASLGRFTFEYGSSANFIEARDNKIFVATGKGGLKILELVELEPTEPCETLWERIVELFPERANIHEEDHPAHSVVQDGLPGTIELLEDAPVYITFIHNGAGWHNQFGYYAYHKDNMPETAEDLDKEIIYHYVNKNNVDDEVGREMGERVRLGGDDHDFKAGTVIGFYIVADGINPENLEERDPRHIVYTTPEFNPDGVRKHVLFLEKSCLEIVLGFEDMLEGSDEDFNDIIFNISNGDDQFGNQTNYALDIPDLPVL